MTMIWKGKREFLPLVRGWDRLATSEVACSKAVATVIFKTDVG